MKVQRFPMTKCRVLGSLLFASVGVFTMLSVACGGETYAASPPPTNPATQAPPSPETATTATASPSATPWVVADPVVDAATLAATRFFAATTDPAICAQQPPRTQACLARLPENPDSPEHGIVTFEVGFIDGGGAMVVFGRDEAGGWQFWFGTQQQTYQPLRLPAEARICAGGEGANVRQAPDVSAMSLGVLKDGTMLTAEDFVLTQPGSNAPGSPLGNGWYRVTGALNGFIRADLLSDAGTSGCGLHDAIEQGAAR